MLVQAVDWGVMVVGAWNRAILTPDGIRKRLFGLSDGSTVDIEVAIDRPGAFRVRHDGVIVEPTPMALAIFGETNEQKSIEACCQVASTALSSLPETPVSAAGINYRYRISEMSDAIIEKLECQLDDVLSDDAHEIVGRSIKRTIKVENGVLNLEIVQGEGSDDMVMFNFHLDSADIDALKEWLGKAGAFELLTIKLMKQIGFIEEGL
ncbi:MAG: hypothetical protein ACK4SR_07655 [Thiobacillus sp.]